MRPLSTLCLLVVLGACKSGGYVATPANVASWNHAREMLDFNADSNFGGGTLRSGFTPDPWGFPLTAGGGQHPVNVADLGMVDAFDGSVCGRSFVTRRPDFHFTFHAGTTFNFLRFYVVTNNNSDATLVINEPNGQWRCNDDHGHLAWGSARMPAIDFHNPPAGRYDIWVGSYDATANNPATLYVTEVESNHP
ncbi:MAG: hypothetical protein HY909_16185 [Deltaproteobacteria bacterium]|nr:hypothetical protein [Deltaproteobacteria bacterium]